MPDHLPLTASGPRAPQKAQPIPKAVRAAIALLVRGRDDDENCEPLDFVAAAREAGIRPDTLRRHFDRPAVRSLLLAERRRFRDILCATNEASLARIRNGENAMAAVKAVQVLEQLGEEAAVRSSSAAQTPGVTIRIVNVTAPPAEPHTINLTPEPLPEPLEQPSGEPVFHPPTPRLSRA